MGISQRGTDLTEAEEVMVATTWLVKMENNSFTSSGGSSTESPHQDRTPLVQTQFWPDFLTGPLADKRPGGLCQSERQSINPYSCVTPRAKSFDIARYRAVTIPELVDHDRNRVASSTFGYKPINNVDRLQPVWQINENLCSGGLPNGRGMFQLGLPTPKAFLFLSLLRDEVLGTVYWTWEKPYREGWGLDGRNLETGAVDPLEWLRP
ncbi:hypothetical protein IQ06DRAFT_343956 [Phaeosphaeriaceae sp. SRC1lsM3a]|nr:hypothetical protein IQ06DRAFT_343956 [Stagonospora sp. SRC1lsM3a]